MENTVFASMIHSSLVIVVVELLTELWLHEYRYQKTAPRKWGAVWFVIRRASASRVGVCVTGW